jgi:hypothetical protein
LLQHQQSAAAMAAAQQSSQSTSVKQKIQVYFENRGSAAE